LFWREPGGKTLWLRDGTGGLRARDGRGKEGHSRIARGSGDKLWIPDFPRKEEGRVGSRVSNWRHEGAVWQDVETGLGKEDSHTASQIGA